MRAALTGAAVATHKCSSCGLEFEANESMRVVNSIRYLLYPFHGWHTQFKKFTQVRCPRCKHEEHDPTIRVFGIFPHKALIYIFVLALILAVVDAIYQWTK